MSIILWAIYMLIGIVIMCAAMVVQKNKLSLGYFIIHIIAYAFLWPLFLTYAILMALIDHN